MSKKCTRKKTKFVGTRNLIDEITGEVIQVKEISIEERDANFHKIWLGHIIQALDMIGNQKIKILSFILDNLNRDNQLIMTQRKLSEKCGVSYQTVTITMKSLQNADFLIKINSGTYQVNPNAIFKGGTGERMRILFNYQDLKEK
jgi:DNA-binding transcriptional regulator YhcF (GntR family)